MTPTQKSRQWQDRGVMRSSSLLLAESSPSDMKTTSTWAGVPLVPRRCRTSLKAEAMLVPPPTFLRSSMKAECSAKAENATKWQAVRGGQMVFSMSWQAWWMDWLNWSMDPDWSLTTITTLSSLSHGLDMLGGGWQGLAAAFISPKRPPERFDLICGRSRPRPGKDSENTAQLWNKSTARISTGGDSDLLWKFYSRCCGKMSTAGNSTESDSDLLWKFYSR